LLQAAVRSSKGEDITVFERIDDGSRTIRKGDVVRLHRKPVLMGRVLYFFIGQVRNHMPTLEKR
jgi:hypothetical protein